MLILELTSLLIIVAGCNGDILSHLMATVEPHSGTGRLQHIDDLSGLAEVEGAGAHRGPQWYDYDTDIESSDSELDDGASSSLTLSSEDSSDKKTSGASSAETKEKRLAHRVYRDCTPCPLDMLKKYKNMGIKWICGGYQRARRSFKSECMMRYRNCQDGTMFVKVSEHRCVNDVDEIHGRSWFYVYQT